MKDLLPKNKKSLIGWVSKDWMLYYNRRYIRHTDIFQRRYAVPDFPVKVRITIEELK